MDDFKPHVYKSIRDRPGYIGNGLKFLLSTSWVHNHRRDYLFDDQCIVPLLCSVVGIVAEDGLQIEPHGDFLPPYGFENAQIHFTIRCPPSTYPGLKSDFQQGLSSIFNLIDVLCDKPNASNVLGHDNEGLGTLKFSHKLFKKKYGEPRDSPDDARFLPVSKEYRPYLEPLHGKYILNALPTFNSASHPRSFWGVKDVMKGAMVKVEFYLYYEFELGLQASIARMHVLKPGSAHSY